MSFSDAIDLDAGRWRGAVRESDGRHHDPMEPPRVLLVGEDNPVSSSEEYQMYDYPPNCSGARLRDHLGLDSAAYIALWRTNLCCPSWNAARARERAALLLSRHAPWEVIVALGRTCDATAKSWSRAST